MTKIPEVTKEQLLKMIDELDNNPNDKIRILGDIGIISLGGLLGGACAGFFAGLYGVTSIFGLTAVASWLGWTAVLVTPVGWIIGSSVGAGAIAYAVSRMIYGGGLSEGSKMELMQKYREDVQNIKAREKSGNIADADRTQFILSLGELIDKNLVSPDKAFKLIKLVEEGRISLSYAFTLIQPLLYENQFLNYCKLKV